MPNVCNLTSTLSEELEIALSTKCMHKICNLFGQDDIQDQFHTTWFMELLMQVEGWHVVIHHVLKQMYLIS